MTLRCSTTSSLLTTSRYLPAWSSAMMRLGTSSDLLGAEPHRHLDAGEEAGQQVAVGVLEQAAHQDRAGRGVDFGRDVVEVAVVGIAFLVHQADIERDLG